MTSSAIALENRANLEIEWPMRHDLMGVMVSATDYQEVVDRLVEAAEKQYPAIATFHAAHALVSASGDADLRSRVNSFDIVATDGQPLRWALNSLYGSGLRDRVYGPEAMLRMCQRAAQEGMSIYLYGGASDTVLDKLIHELKELFPELQIAGAESPPFRPLTEEEDQAVVDRINDSGADFVFVGLGMPKQDHFAFEHRDRLQAVQLCVGAAFDFHAKIKPMAPGWMQRNGLEWLFRLCSEPRRLAKRYFTTNSLFVIKFLNQWFRQKVLGMRPTVAGQS